MFVVAIRAAVVGAIAARARLESVTVRVGAESGRVAVFFVVVAYLGRARELACVRVVTVIASGRGRWVSVAVIAVGEVARASVRQQ